MIEYFESSHSITFDPDRVIAPRLNRPKVKVAEVAGEPTSPQGTYCPICGYDLRGTIGDALVCCSECGARSYPRDLLVLPPPGPLARVLLTAGSVGIVLVKITIPVFLVFAILGLLLPSLGRSRCGCGANKTGTQLSQIFRAESIYAEAHDGAYPQHIAMLVSDHYFNPDLLVDNYATAPANSMIGDIDLAQYDWTEQSQTALTNAIQATDLTEPFYKVGDFWFARHVKSFLDGNLIMGWSEPDAKALRWVVFDDSALRRLSPEDWNAAWKADTIARRRHLLPTVEQPQ